LPAAGVPATVAGLIVARPTAATLAIPTAAAGGGRTAVTGFAADGARIRAVVAEIRAVVAVISGRRLGAGIGDGYRSAGTGQHQRTGDRTRRQTHIRPSIHSASPHWRCPLQNDLKQSRQQPGTTNLVILYPAAIVISS
jgi:hypothetical protein